PISRGAPAVPVPPGPAARPLRDGARQRVPVFLVDAAGRGRARHVRLLGGAERAAQDLPGREDASGSGRERSGSGSPANRRGVTPASDRGRQGPQGTGLLLTATSSCQTAPAPLAP